MNEAASGVKRPRADFARNRQEILQVAERSFAAGGVGVSLEIVAREAGVGSATLYRHFASRDALLAAVLRRREDELGLERARLEAMDDAGEALDGWLLALEHFFGTFEGLADPMRTAALDKHHPLATTCTGFIDTTGQFLRAAHRQGRAKGDVRARDLFLAALALSWTRSATLAEESDQHRLRQLLAEGWSTVGQSDGSSQGRARLQTGGSPV